MDAKTAKIQISVLQNVRAELNTLAKSKSLNIDGSYVIYDYCTKITEKIDEIIREIA